MRDLQIVRWKKVRIEMSQLDMFFSICIAFSLALNVILFGELRSLKRIVDILKDGVINER